MQLSIKTNFPEVQKQLDRLRKEIADKAVASALNKTVAQAKTAMSREIRSEFVMTAATVNESLRIRRARASGGAFNLQAALESPKKRGRSLNLARFSARQTKKGVSFKIRRGGPRKLIPGSFLINNGKTMMIRVGKKRLPIKALQTIDVAQMFNTTRINRKVVALVQKRFPTIFANDVRFFTNRFNAGR
jgi:hypothetical protein